MSSTAVPVSPKIDWRTQTDGTALIADDPWLEPFADALRARHSRYTQTKSHFDPHGGLLGQISTGHHFFGFNRGTLYDKPGVWYREWAPAALQLRLVGDFNQWNRDATPMVRDSFGTWSIFLPDSEFKSRLTHGSKVKVHVIGESSRTDRIPAYIRRVEQDPTNHQFTGVYWNPPEQFAWKHPSPAATSRAALRIYEAHVGMAQEQGKVGTYAEFEQNILPRIAALGYNAIQLMAVMEHPYYGSFGYHVSSFFAASSRFGTPEDLKRLIDTAHGLGLRVIMDIIHSHAVKNTQEGLNRFDGSDYQYFHAGPRGQHQAWDSLCFDYSKYEVLRFLLSNVRYWLEEFRFDGFRFDGVTSMVYLNHGLGTDFSGYHDYFGPNIDTDAVAYLTLANELAHAVRPAAITIAEDVSGLAGIAKPIAAGGVGFDYRLAMGVPDFWIKTLKEQSDEQLDLQNVWHTLLNRRHGEKHIGYAESHDQSLVGDKTLAFRLMDAEMYWNMAYDRPSPVVDRDVALHKMIRLITFALAGEGYLNFMGNEFGHPEWVDFPREGNGHSYQHARRQWSLPDNPTLRYAGLNAFDAAMQNLDEQFHIVADPLIDQLACHNDTKQLVFRRGPIVFAFNFHPSESFRDLRIPVPEAFDYQSILDTDDPKFAGLDRTTPGQRFPSQTIPMYGWQQSIQIYLPARSALVLRPVR